MILFYNDLEVKIPQKTSVQKLHEYLNSTHVNNGKVTESQSKLMEDLYFQSTFQLTQVLKIIKGKL